VLSYEDTPIFKLECMEVAMGKPTGGHVG